MAEPSSILSEVEDRVLTLTINRPGKLNALNRQVIRGLADAVERAGGDDGIGAIVLTGAGEKAFVAGADIAEMSGLTPTEARDFAREGQALGAMFDRAGKPVIAAVNGFALGGGCELALACHMRVASPNARFGQPEVSLGLIPGFGGTQRLTRVVGETRALEMILGGAMIDAEKAELWGLVNVVARESSAVAEARRLAGEMLTKGPVAIRLSIEAIRVGSSMPLEEALELEAALFGVCFSTEDMREGTQAFLEKRKPAFQGR
ncbi:MAG: enoyl-CoA hydratase-related protein [Acidobacteriota bacterium]|nr:enoyl-CoA hydratase-related protein [Acidobacteriota bacterium]